jgi:hypothetical protein
MMPRSKPKLPDDWGLKLYDFTKDMPLEGWVWEFMRRARLKRLLGKEYFNAMYLARRKNITLGPDQTQNLDPDHWNYYRPWSWYQKRNRKPFSVSPSVVTSTIGWPKGFHGQQYRVPDESLDQYALARLDRPFVNLRVDLNRQDTRIRKDFDELLKSLRVKHRLRQNSPHPEYSKWYKMLVLPCWDLKQFGLSQQELALTFPRFRYNYGGELLPNKERVKNSLKVTRSYIDRGEWIKLAYHI